MAELFNFLPLEDLGGDVTFEADSAPFGDGYEQVSEEGINPRRDTVDLQFWGHKVDDNLDAIKAFLDRHRGAKPFLWQGPNDAAPKLWMIADRKYKWIRHNGDFLTINVTFRERITP